MFRERDCWRDAEQRGSKDFILRSGASRVSKDEATEPENALIVIPLGGKTRASEASRGLPLAGACGMIAATELKAAKAIAASTGRF